MSSEFSCEAIQLELSAHLDGESERDAGAALEAHVRSCDACRSQIARLEAVRRRLRTQPAEAVPDLSARIMERVRAEVPRRDRRREWATRVRIAAVGAAAAALVVIGASLPWSDRPPATALGAQIEARLQDAARLLDTYRASFEITERGWHPAVPLRRFTAQVAFEAPERFSLSVRDHTRYPNARGWPRNDVDLIANGTRWWLEEPVSCPVQAFPGCTLKSAVEKRTVVNRQPFDGTTPLATDIVIPLETVSSASSLRVVGDALVTGRDTYHVELPYHQAVPLITGLQSGGSWRDFHPLDRVEIWIDRTTSFPLRVRVIAGASPDRALWADSHGYSDHSGDVLLDVEATSFAKAEDARGTVFEPPRGGIVRDGRFTAVPFRRARTAFEPAFLAGLEPYRAGITDQDQKVVAYADGLLWLKMTDGGRRVEPASYPSTAEEVRVGSGWAYYQPAGRSFTRRVDLYGPRGAHVQLESNLPRAELLRVAASVPLEGRPLARRVASKDLTITRIQAGEAPRAARFARTPAYLPPGYRSSTAFLSRSGAGKKTVTFYYRRPEAEYDGFGLRITQSRPVQFLPPSSEELVEVSIGGSTGRWSTERGELEWIENDVYRAVAIPSFDLHRALRIARSIR